MSQAPIPYGRQSIDDEDIAAVTAALRSDFLTQGPLVREFEAALAERCGSKHVVAFMNGTAALHAAAFAAGVKAGDEAVTSPLTFAASANSILYMGGRPVFADVRPDTGNVDPAAVERALTKKTRAVVAVDYAGHPAELDRLAALCKKRGVTLIEDAAHSLGARLGGRPVGALADLTTFSFHPVKTITCGEGGAVATDSPDLKARLELFRTHGITRDAGLLEMDELRGASWHYEMLELGMNFRIPDILCALGLSQLKKLDRFVERRRAIVARYNAAFAGVDALELPPELPGARAAWHIYPLRFKGLKTVEQKRALVDRYAERGVRVNVHYMPLYLHPFYRRLGYAAGLCPNAEDYWRRMLTLPLFPAMSDADADRVVAATKEAVSEVLAGA